VSIVASIRSSLVPVHRAGYPFIAIGLILTIAAGFVSSALAWIAAIITGWVIHFFRDPPRTTPQSAELIVSPADGRVSMIVEVLPPPELQLPAKPMLRVSVFMSIFDCHVNRMPIAGRVSRIAYTPGRFVNADLDKASEHNERNALAIASAHGPIAVVQIAGLIARRIVSFSKEGDSVQPGERIGLIRFGSRVDVYMPDTATPTVDIGSKTVAGETVIADLAARTPRRVFRSA